MALEMVLICSTGDDEPTNPLKPTTVRASNDIDGYFDVARRIFTEKKRVKIYEAARTAEALRITYEREAQAHDKIKHLPSGGLTPEKVSILRSLTQENISDLLYDSDFGFEDAEAFTWIFSQADCEIANVTAFIEMWDVAEPCLLVTKEDNFKDIRVEMLPVYKAIATGLNTLGFSINEFGVNEHVYNKLKSMIDDQKAVQTSGKTLMFELNPQILFHYKTILENHP